MDIRILYNDKTWFDKFSKIVNFFEKFVRQKYSNLARMMVFCTSQYYIHGISSIIFMEDSFLFF